jgi:hypothetical protein
LLYIKPNRTARPKEREHLNAGISLLLLTLVDQLLIHVLLKNPVCLDGVLDPFCCVGVIGFPSDLQWRSFMQNKKKKEGKSWCLVEIV